MKDAMALLQAWRAGEYATLQDLARALPPEQGDKIAFQTAFQVVRLHLLTPDEGFRELEKIYGPQVRSQLRNLPPQPLLEYRLPLWCRSFSDEKLQQILEQSL